MNEDRRARGFRALTREQLEEEDGEAARAGRAEVFKKLEALKANPVVLEQFKRLAEAKARAAAAAEALGVAASSAATTVSSATGTAAKTLGLDRAAEAVGGAVGAVAGTAAEAARATAEAAKASAPVKAVLSNELLQKVGKEVKESAQEMLEGTVLEETVGGRVGKNDYLNKKRIRLAYQTFDLVPAPEKPAEKAAKFITSGARSLTEALGLGKDSAAGNLIRRAAQSVGDVVAAGATLGSDMKDLVLPTTTNGRALAITLLFDPEFDPYTFTLHCRDHIIPQVMTAHCNRDPEALKDLVTPKMLNFIKASWAAEAGGGVIDKSRFIAVQSVTFSGATLSEFTIEEEGDEELLAASPEGMPCMQIAFSSTITAHTVNAKTGATILGGPDQIVHMSSRWAVKLEVEEERVVWRVNQIHNTGVAGYL